MFSHAKSVKTRRGAFYYLLMKVAEKNVFLSFSYRSGAMKN
jgi:hypothetical protein